ncbi:hypothetical protein CAL13_13895 [Bordetella genomosp. 9]|uniref:Uncharacterized protein n=2 Tax=Bordetella genomosp. 9 TaxID=1416803 RepID=A0A1W6Z1F9_9BORD|nr:hypothetical protein CAL13_13895 [Bordetella genomosp. 9]
MSKEDELRMAMRRWHQAHSEVMDFYERNDIMDPTAYSVWIVLWEAENTARLKTEDLLAEARQEDSDR